MLKTVAPEENRETEQVSIEEVFGLKLNKSQKVTAFKEPGILTPKIDPYYIFPREETILFLMGLESKNTIYLMGHSGTGKTELAKQVAARLNYNLLFINFDGHLTRSDLVGEPVLEQGNVRFRYGLVPSGFNMPGTILLFDEIDSCPPETSFVLQRAVSEDRSFLMVETNEVFPLHSQNVIVGTANTAGLGDDTGLYTAGTNIQNYSFMTRWQMVLKLDYLSAAQEQEMLQKRFPNMAPGLISAVCSVLASARESYKNQELIFPLTTRDAINWLQKISQIAYPMKAAKVSFLHKMPVDDARSVAEIIQRWFTLPAKDDQTYTG